MRQSIDNIAKSPYYLSPQVKDYTAKGEKIYFGTGLASSKEESLGFGFELLSTVLTSLALMREFEAESVLHEIGTVGYNIPESLRGRLIAEQLELVMCMIKNLGLEDVYNIETSHSYHGTEYFMDILQYVKTKLDPFYNLQNFQSYGNYTIIQIAQMKYLYETEDAGVKLGWIVGNNPILDNVDQSAAVSLIKQGRLSEYYFDSLYRYVFPEDEFYFVYIPAGMDMVSGMKYAPYTVTKSQNRPLLTQPIREYLSKIPDSYNKRRSLKNYEKTIINNWECLFGEIKTSEYISNQERLIDKLEYIQNRVLGT
ncbi:MAG: hypothetical protein FWH14_08675 [Oscillospiraceae bacterium]|nr:hypothetical protein [Oscillospiraceae bacterium]